MAGQSSGCIISVTGRAGRIGHAGQFVAAVVDEIDIAVAGIGDLAQFAAGRVAGGDGIQVTVGLADDSPSIVVA